MGSGCGCPTGRAPAGRRRHCAHVRLPYHGHGAGFATIVLAGRAIEAGDTGRHRVTAGDVLVHGSWEHHLDHVEACGAEVFALPLPFGTDLPAIGTLTDPDAVVKAAEQDYHEAIRIFEGGFEAVERIEDMDWPSLLAREIRRDPDLRIADWARAAGIHASSVSRGFRQSFGITPARYRMGQRTLSAARAVAGSAQALSTIAAGLGFADQAHMTRSVGLLTGYTPAALRKAVSRKKTIHAGTGCGSSPRFSAW